MVFLTETVLLSHISLPTAGEPETKSTKSEERIDGAETAKRVDFNHMIEDSTIAKALPGNNGICVKCISTHC